MSINPIGRSAIPAATPHAAQPQRQKQTTAATAAPLGQVTQTPQGANELPLEAPAGTDPAVWAVLTTEERQYFARAAAMGPVTYGRVTTGKPTVLVGARIDVKA